METHLWIEWIDTFHIGKSHTPGLVRNIFRTLCSFWCSKASSRHIQQNQSFLRETPSSASTGCFKLWNSAQTDYRVVTLVSKIIERVLQESLLFLKGTIQSYEYRFYSKIFSAPCMEAICGFSRGCVRSSAWTGQAAASREAKLKSGD